MDWSPHHLSGIFQALELSDMIESYLRNQDLQHSHTYSCAWQNSCLIPRKSLRAVLGYIGNVESVYEVLQRRSDFRREVDQMSVLNVYGKNLATTDGQEWQKHRKVTAIAFTDKNNELVWKASLAQADGMLRY